MSIPTEPVGSIPRAPELQDAVQKFKAGELPQAELEAMLDEAIRNTIQRFEATGSPVISDGEQAKINFAIYPIDGLPNLKPGDKGLGFADGHRRTVPQLTEGPLRYQTYADSYLERAQKYASRPIKQAVISASMISLAYPDEGIESYPREKFLDDLVNEAEREIRRCLAKGAYDVQVDFTEGRLAHKIDPSGELLSEWVRLNNRVLERFSDEERKKLGVHTCPGGDQDSTHSLDVDYAELLPQLFELKAGNFFMQLASEKDRQRVLRIVRECAKPYQRIFVGVIDPINPRLESPEEVKQRVLEAARHIEPERLGTTDDCGFSPFTDDRSTSRDLAFDKIRARVEGTELASRELGV